MVELLYTKLLIPRPRANVVARPRLVERLNAGRERKLALVAAPAGFGKTILLSEWISTSAHCVTWLALDEEDNDPIKFWSYFISALQRLDAGLGTGALAALQAEPGPPINSILTAILNDAAAFPDTFSIVLDDYHLIDAEPIHQALNFLLAHMPQNMRLVISTRVDPPLPLARLRARDQMTELRANDLRFTTQEASEFLGSVMGLRLSAEQVGALEARTEGWIAGLQIAALSMQGREDVSGFINAFSGSHRHILGYLAEEVLDRQPPAVLDLLLKTSILDRLCGPLCDAVTGETGGQEILETLVNANLFLTPLDEEGVWYRYHHLFVQVLRRRASMLPGDEIPVLHRRAGEWFEKAGQVDEALRHALAAGDYAGAANLVEKHIARVLAHGELFRLRGWLEQFPPEVLPDYPRLVLMQARILGLAGNMDEAERLLARSPGLSGEDALSDDLRGELALLQSAFARFRGQMSEAILNGRHALDLLAPTNYVSRATALTNISISHLMLGEQESARRALTEIIAFGEAAAPLPVWHATVHLAWNENKHGRTAGLAEAMQRMIRQVERASIPSALVLGIAWHVLGEIEYERNDLENARQSVERAITYLQITMEQVFLALSYTRLARVVEATGDPVGAQAVLERGDTWLERMKMNDLGFSTVLASERVQMMLRQGRLDSAVQLAGELDRPRGRPSAFTRELAKFGQARVYAALGKSELALSLLDELQASWEPKQWADLLFQAYCQRAVILRAQGALQPALEVLSGALALGEEAGYLRAWLDEGEPVRKLLLEYRANLPSGRAEKDGRDALRFAAYLDRVLDAFPHVATGDMRPGNQKLSEALNERELGILKLIAAGYSNREIADELVIAPSTVKWYINNLYAKLGANSRTRALALAREMQLL